MRERRVGARCAGGRCVGGDRCAGGGRSLGLLDGAYLAAQREETSSTALQPLSSLSFVDAATCGSGVSSWLMGVDLRAMA